jgi:6-pyruvoyltetrahydropterin/6-carboxytetrahydropterin synthase
MFILEKSFRFEAAHHLPYHMGLCARVHGHSWQITVAVAGTKLGTYKSGSDSMLLDYGDIKSVVQPIVNEYLDHWDLNVTTGLESPTSEALAVWLWGKLGKSFTGRAHLYSITVEETCTSKCTYTGAYIEGDA